jgi:hypothetical protein
MRRTRARGLALAVVIGSALGSAYAGLVIDPVGPTSDPIPLNSPDQLVFSIRNNGSQPFAISSLTQTVVTAVVASDGCPQMNLMPVGYAYNSPIPPGGQAQFAVSTTGYPAAGTYNCTYSIATLPSQGSASVTATFNIVGTGSTPADFQPRAMQFGPVPYPGYEQQAFSLTNYMVSNSFMTLSINGDPSNLLSLSCGGHSCVISTPPANTPQQMFVKCTSNGTGTGVTGATLAIYDGSATQVGSDVAIDCTAFAGSGSGSSIGMLMFSQNPLVITPPANSSAVGTDTLTTTDATTTMLVAEGLSGTDLSPYSLGDCGGVTSCSGLTLPLSTGNPRSVAVTCDLSIQPNPQPAMLTVMDNAGNMATAGVMCTGTGSGSGSGSAMLAAGPSPVMVGSVLVGMSGSGSFSIGNSGNPSRSINNIVLSLAGTDPTEFSVMGLCPSSAPCSIGPSGTPLTIPVTFSPGSHGPKDATVFITSDAGNATVTLDGTGLGAVMSAPSPATVDFHTIPKNQTFTQSVTIGNGGNIGMPVTFGTPSSPYTITPPTGGTTVPGPGSADWTVSCGSNAASASNDQTVAITSTNPPTYAGAPQSVMLKCAIADTLIQISPTTFDFGENRVGAQVAPITVTVTNPANAPGPANLTKLALDVAKTGLSLTPATTSQMLNPGDTATAVLALDTGADTDLTGELLDITVDGNAFQFNVTGSVVTPHSRIAPSSLQLGTACVGTQVSGTVMLINDGTASLHVFKPTTDSGFTAEAQSPMSYPTGGAIVAPGTTATTKVAPSASASGMLSSALHWSDDVPNDYTVPVTLDYVANGTAVSPAALDFGSVEVGQQSSSQEITAQNCEQMAKPFKVRALRGKAGSGPIGAWKLSPKVGYSTTLAANQKLVVTAYFDPPGRGHYEADLELDTDIGVQTIHLTADATGRDFDHTDVYACSSCNGGGVTGGWPIVLAFILVRRRRGSSSPR